MHLLVALLCMFTVTASYGALAFAQQPLPGELFHFAEQPGPYAVGLKVVNQYDYSRTFLSITNDLGKPTTGERARPIQTLIWYPAKATSATKMSVGDYTQLLATETSFDQPLLSSDWQSWIKGMALTLKDRMWAVPGAVATTGRFPVLIYAPSFGAMSWENADLCEYLASHGYLVIASPDMGATTRSMTMALEGVEAQARDISFLIGYARTLPNADTSEVAVVGFSWGGISNLFAAARDNRIDALVALDGSMRYFPGLIKQSGYVRPDEITLPLLYFTQGEISLENIERNHSSPLNIGPNVLNEWVHGDLITVHDLALVHQEHSSMYQRNEDIWKNFAHDRKADYARADGITGYTWICRYTVHFLDAYLKHDAAALAWLRRTPAENGVPAHLIATDYRPAQAEPASYEALRAEVGKQGFDHVAAIYATMQKEKPDFRPTEESLQEWSTHLVDEAHTVEAIDILNLACQLYPKSADDEELLGEAYLKAGQKQVAADAFKKALELDPENVDAQGKLKELQATESPLRN